MGIRVEDNEKIAHKLGQASATGVVLNEAYQLPFSLMMLTPKDATWLLERLEPLALGALYGEPLAASNFLWAAVKIIKMMLQDVATADALATSIETFTGEESEAA